METSCIRDLLDSISQFSLLSSKNETESDLIQGSFQDIEDVLKHLRPILEKISTFDFAQDEEINLLLEKLNVIITKAREIVGRWHHMMSKIYFVLQFGSVITKLCTNLIETCGAIGALFQSLGMHSSVQYAEQCAQKARYITDQQTSSIIRVAILDQMKNALPRSEHISKIGQFLGLSTNQELLMEIVALDKLKSEIGHGDNLAEVEYIDHMIALVCHLHNCHVDKHQVHSINNVPVPADFCCPLSLELMSDPVIVASGQTYEHTFIRKWLDQGFTVCPKTQQTLGHANLIPNYTVKALIANWCDTNGVKLPNPAKMLNLNDRECNALSSGQKKTVLSRSHFCNGSPQEAEQNDKITSSAPPSLLTCLSLWEEDESGTNIGRLSLKNMKVKASSLEKWDADSVGQSSNLLDSPHLADAEAKVNGGSASVSSIVDNVGHFQEADGNMASRVPSDASCCSNVASNEVKQEPPSTMPSRASECVPRLNELRRRNLTIWQRASDRFSPRIMSSSMDTGPDLSGVETQVRKLIEDLKSDSIDEQRNAAGQLRLLAKHSVHNRNVISNCGAITHLVSLLHSSDQKIQGDAVTALLNLSIDDNNKIAIAAADVIDPLIHVLKTGNPEAKANSAATFYSLAVNEQNKAIIGRSDAIVSLVDLLVDGTLQGKRDAATALYNLSTFHANRARIVQAGAVRHLVELMDPAAGMVDKAVSVLSNLSSIPEGRSAIGRENGIPVLVEVVELGSSKGKENAAAALLQLCTSSSRLCDIVLKEGVMPPLVALSHYGTPRAKEKAQSLLSYFRNQRHGNSWRK